MLFAIHSTLVDETNLDFYVQLKRYEESNAIGSLAASTAARTELAAASHAFNRKNQIFCELFTDAADGGGGGAEGDDVQDEEGPSESVCRFCLTSGGELIAPCTCS